METLEALQKLCTVPGCTEERADQSPDATNRHCRKHRAEAQKRHMSVKVERAGSSAWIAGVEAMREFLADQFGKYGPLQRWDGPAIAKIIRECGRPVPPDQLP